MSDMIVYVIVAPVVPTDDTDTTVRLCPSKYNSVPSGSLTLRVDVIDDAGEAGLAGGSEKAGIAFDFSVVASAGTYEIGCPLKSRGVDWDKLVSVLLEGLPKCCLASLSLSRINSGASIE